ncbi:MAG: SGNH/GDSL hydrolase family protein [Arenicellales bacterium]|nr:SGNH/GDSL hydrolase family protein [Arenicellales bacterium]
MKGVIPRFICAALIAALFVVLIEIIFFGSSIKTKHFLRLTILFWMLIEVGRIFLVGVVRNSRIGAKLKNLITLGFTFFVSLLLLEGVFTFVPQSHGVGYTLASQNWFSYFWQTNSLGYRDKPLSEIDQEKPRILILGDSFTTGHGIRRPEQTYAGRLRKMIGDQFEVLNLGRNGADPRTEFRDLNDYPYKPDILVLQYYGNDIQSAIKNSDIVFDGFAPYAGLNPLSKFLVKQSYLLNYLYWQFPRADIGPYTEFLKQAYAHPETIQAHFADLGMFVKYSIDCKVPLLAIIFPFLGDIEGSSLFTEPVGEYFNDQKVPVINVIDILQDISLSKRVVNLNDPHPSTTLHRRVAEAILERLATLNWLDPRAVEGPSLC